MTSSTHNEAATIFREDSREKKNIAHSASRRVGMRKGCKFIPRTATEQKKLNGPCTTYRLDEPMTWAQFTQLPLNIQQEYVENLAKKYRVAQYKLCDLFGATQAAIANYFDGKKFSTLYESTIAAAGPDSEPDLVAWNQFVNSLWRPKADPEQLDVEDVMGKVATELLALRAELNISQNKLAELLGCSRVAVSRGERQACSKAYSANLWKLITEYKERNSKLTSTTASAKGQDVDERGTLAAKMRELRTVAKLTQQEVADMLCCSIATVSRAEHGHISVKAARRLLETLMANCKHSYTDQCDVDYSEEQAMKPDMVEVVTLTGPVRDVLDTIWKLFGETGDNITITAARNSIATTN